MQLTYKNKAIEKVCTNYGVAKKKHGENMAEKIHLRVDQISEAETVEDMVAFGIGRCHPLQANRKNQYAVDLVHPHRLVFEKVNNEIQLVQIDEIIDYH